MFGRREKRANAKMIAQQIKARGITDKRVLAALEATDRKTFVPDDYIAMAYDDNPLPLGPGSTVSQPFIVALMTQLLDIQSDHRVLEIGTGSGYQAAVLSRLGGEIWTVEFQPALVAYAKERLDRAGVFNVTVVQGDGWLGLVEHAPYDRIVVTAAADELPAALVEQLAVGGRMVLPIGARGVQDLLVVDRISETEVRQQRHSGVKFVPLVHPDLPPHE